MISNPGVNFFVTVKTEQLDDCSVALTVDVIKFFVTVESVISRSRSYSRTTSIGSRTTPKNVESQSSSISQAIEASLNSTPELVISSEITASQVEKTEPVENVCDSGHSDSCSTIGATSCQVLVTNGTEIAECTCKTGYSGEKCEIQTDNCEASSCSHGTCTSKISGFECNCEDEYTGEFCEISKFCATNPCGEGDNSRGVCNSEASVCECADGFSGDSCFEEDLCFTGGFECFGQGSCESVDGGCVCKNGYVSLNGDLNCEVIERADEESFGESTTGSVTEVDTTEIGTTESAVLVSTASSETTQVDTTVASFSENTTSAVLTTVDSSTHDATTIDVVENTAFEAAFTTASENTTVVDPSIEETTQLSETTPEASTKYLTIELSLQFTVNFNEATGFQKNGAEFINSITSKFKTTIDNITGISFINISFDELIPIQTFENSNSRKRLVRQVSEADIFTLFATIELNVYDDLYLDQVLEKVASGIEILSEQVVGMSNVIVAGSSGLTTSPDFITPQMVIQVRNDVFYAVLFPIMGLMLVGSISYFWYLKRRRTGHYDI
jgi:hypothetical protein